MFMFGLSFLIVFCLSLMPTINSSCSNFMLARLKCDFWFLNALRWNISTFNSPNNIAIHCFDFRLSYFRATVSFPRSVWNKHPMHHTNFLSHLTMANTHHIISLFILLIYRPNSELVLVRGVSIQPLDCSVVMRVHSCSLHAEHTGWATNISVSIRSVLFTNNLARSVYITVFFCLFEHIAPPTTNNPKFSFARCSSVSTSHSIVTHSGWQKFVISFLLFM